MNTKFDGIAEFIAVARLGSFTATAAELDLSKSAVGRTVSRLEARLGAKLLHRTTRRLTLTADGQTWLEHCVAAVAELEEGMDVLSNTQGEPSGRVRIDLPSAFGRMHIMPLLLGLAERFPGLMLNVSFTDRRVDLIGEGIDLAVRIGVLDDTPDLAAHSLGIQQMVICAAPNYLATREPPLRASDLVQHDCIAGWRRERHAVWLLKQPDGSTSPQIVPVKHEIYDAEMMLAAARAGRGLAQLPLWLAGADIRHGKLVTVLDGMSGGELPITILWPRLKNLPARLRIVIDEIGKTANRFAGSIENDDPRWKY